MVMSLPKIRARVADRIKLPEVPDRTELVERIKLPDVPDRAALAELAGRIKLPDLPDGAELAQRIKTPSLPDLPEIDLSSLPRRFPWRQRRAANRGAAIRSAAITMAAIALIGVVAALAAYFLDPDRGKFRRTEAANRLAGLRQQARSRVQEWGGSGTSSVGSNAVVSDGDQTLLVPEKSPLNGEMASPDGPGDELVRANPGL